MTPEQIVEFAEGLARVTASGGGTRALAAHLASVSGAGVLVEDAQWRHIAAAGDAELPPSGRATALAGAPGRCVQVVAANAHVGWISLFEPPGTGGRFDREALEYLLRLTASAVAIELARDAHGPASRGQTFWERLLDRTYNDANSARDDAAARGIALAPAYIAIALEAEALEESADLPDATQLRAVAVEAFRGNDAGMGYFERGPILFAFVPATREIDASNARTAAGLLPKLAIKRKSQFRVSGGIGTVESPLMLHLSAQAAETALSIGRRMYGHGRILAYEDAGAYALLARGAEVGAFQAFARDVLAPLRAYDEKHQAELERTLRVYFAAGQNVKTAAAQLNVHRHTVFYRLRQIGDMCDRSLESPHDQLTFRLAVAIDALHSS